MPIDTIFFDIGNTLLFPDHEKTLAPLRRRGVRPTDAQLHSAECVARQEMELLLSRNHKVDQQYWETYYSHLLRELGISDVPLRLELVSLARTPSSWTRIMTGTFETLESLKRKYRAGSDFEFQRPHGRVASGLRSAQLLRARDRLRQSRI
jgi:FMN phosphatase YigB (HAD superfamily)